MSNGWIKIHRKLSIWEWYSDSKTLHVFIDLLIHANHKPGRWRGVEVGVGQIITGRKKISARTGISERSVRTCLKRLESSGEIAIKTTNRFSIITIEKYSEYQERENKNDQQADQQTTNKRPATDQQPTTNKNEKNEKNEKKKEQPSKKTTVIHSQAALKFSNDFYDWLSKTGKGKKEYSKKQIEDGAKEIELLVRIDKYDLEEEIRPAIRWAVNHHFWAGRIKSLATLRKKQKGKKTHKFENMFDQYTSRDIENNIKPRNERELRNMQNEEIARRLNARAEIVSPGIGDCGGVGYTIQGRIQP